MLKLLSLSLFTTTLLSLLLINISISPTTTTILQASALSGIESLLKDDDNNNNSLTYRNSALGIKIDYPSAWTQEVHVGGLVTFIANLEMDSSTYPPPGLGIKVQNLASRNITLNEITKVQIKNLTQDHSDFKLIESTHSILAGTAAHKIVFIATDDKEHKLKAMQIWSAKGDKAYLITYKAEPEAFSKYLPIVQKIINSFQFIDLSGR